MQSIRLANEVSKFLIAFLSWAQMNLILTAPDRISWYPVSRSAISDSYDVDMSTSKSHSGQTYPAEWEHRYGPLGCIPRVTCQEETSVPPQVPICIPFPVLVTQINNYGGTNSTNTFNNNNERPKAME
ncbi:hypothetical protein RvY_12980 [Ramazzottius varieornatus]|uniref:Uncharacterized protein n=1 Tax=Ramazzottius varieornatus TaxID=947166 RepID=A0A1D1VLB4_RAMVA|nr:hypothetical protein RvY_12980 [Ramazzottius varieornatus]